MRYSIMTEPHLGGTYDQQLAAALLAESAGLVSFARCDHYLTDRDPAPEATDAFAVMAGLARETATVRLCILVTPVTFRHPAVIAKSAATIDQMSGGRFDLGIGTGWMDFEHDAFGIPFPDWPERWERFEEALGYLEAAFGDGTSRFDGRHFHLDAEVLPKPRGLRIVIGGDGKERTPRLAGQRADEYNVFLCPPSEARPRIESMREAAAGRPVEATVMGPVVVGSDQADYRRRLERVAGFLGRDPDFLEGRWREQGSLLGTAERVAEGIGELEAAGVERIYVQWLELADHEGLAATVDLLPR